MSFAATLCSSMLRCDTCRYCSIFNSPIPVDFLLWLLCESQVSIYTRGYTALIDYGPEPISTLDLFLFVFLFLSTLPHPFPSLQTLWLSLSKTKMKFNNLVSLSVTAAALLHYGTFVSASPFFHFDDVTPQDNCQGTIHAVKFYIHSFWPGIPHSRCTHHFPRFAR